MSLGISLPFAVPGKLYQCVHFEITGRCSPPHLLKLQTYLSAAAVKLARSALWETWNNSKIRLQKLTYTSSTANAAASDQR